MDAKIVEPTEAAQELAAQVRQERSTIKKDAELMEQLLRHPAWPRFLALIEAVADNHMKVVMTPLSNSFELTKAEYAKGTLNGLSLAASLPNAKISEAKATYGGSQAQDAGD